MTKKELIVEVADKIGGTQKEAKIAIEAVIETVTECLIDGDKLSLTGFGTFEAKERAERNGINPQTLEPLVIPARMAPSFKASKNLKEAMNA